MNTQSISFPLFGDGFSFNPPSYFTIFGFPIYYYAIMVFLGFSLAGLYIYKRREHFELSPDNVIEMVIFAILGGIVGARIYYVLFRFDHFFGPGSNWLDIFRIRQGGLAVYGGIIGAIGLYILYCHIKKIHFFKLFDAGVFGLFIGQSIGRWGNFFNREAFGVETSMPWRMGLTGVTGTIYVHPAFLYESVWNIIGFCILHFYSVKKGRKYFGQYFLFYVAWYGFGRFIIEGLRTDSLFIPGTAIRISQLLALLSCVAALTFLIINHVKKTNTILKELPIDATDILEEYSDSIKDISVAEEQKQQEEENQNDCDETNDEENH